MLIIIIIVIIIVKGILQRHHFREVVRRGLCGQWVSEACSTCFGFLARRFIFSPAGYF
jgi:hypothetical protein